MEICGSYDLGKLSKSSGRSYDLYCDTILTRGCKHLLALVSNAIFGSLSI